MIKGLEGKVDFVPREPDLTDTKMVGNDADTVTHMGSLDIYNFFRREGWVLRNISWPRKAGMAGALVSTLLPFWGSMGMVAEKPKG